MSSKALVVLNHYWIEAHHDLVQESRHGERGIATVSHSTKEDQHHRVVALWAGDLGGEFSYKVRITGEPDDGGVAYLGYEPREGRQRHEPGATWTYETTVRPEMKLRRDVEPERNKITGPDVDESVPSNIVCGVELLAYIDGRYEEREYDPETARWPLKHTERMSLTLAP